MADYYRPSSLAQALEILAERRCRPLAGGTDFYPAESHATAWAQPGLEHPDCRPTLDLSGITELASISRCPDHIELGAMVTWRDALDADLPAWFDAVRLAGREVGGMQIQNRATLVGNLCNASPAADGVPPLLALDARLRLQSAAASRELPLAEFVLGNRRTARRDDELVTAILIPQPPAGARSSFLKLGARRYLVISIAMVAVTINVDDNGQIAGAALAVGACSAVAQRLPALEQRLLGHTPAQAAGLVTEADLAELQPIDDVRASADYRRHAALVLLRRVLAGFDTPTAEQAA